MEYKFKKGDKVRVIKTEATYEEWRGIGKIDVPFEIGDVYNVLDVGYTTGSVQIDHKDYYNYPKEMFDLIDDNLIHELW